jgi:hypothetical protein
VGRLGGLKVGRFEGCGRRAKEESQTQRHPDGIGVDAVRGDRKKKERGGIWWEGRGAERCGGGESLRGFLRDSK